MDNYSCFLLGGFVCSWMTEEDLGMLTRGGAVATEVIRWWLDSMEWELVSAPSSPSRPAVPAEEDPRSLRPLHHQAVIAGGDQEPPSP
eukprot:16434056-Heterocapsa_arctica.AAC.1